jgi:hypothetical protein
MKDKKTIADMAREKGMRPTNVYQRIHDGWTLEQALNTPIGKKKRKIEFDNAWLAVGVSNGIPVDVVRARVYKGMAIEDATTTPYYPRANRKKKAAKKKSSKNAAVTRAPAVESGKTADGIIGSAMIIAIVITILVAFFLDA